MRSFSVCLCRGNGNKSISKQRACLCFVGWHTWGQGAAVMCKYAFECMLGFNRVTAGKQTHFLRRHDCCVTLLCHCKMLLIANSLTLLTSSKKQRISCWNSAEHVGVWWLSPVKRPQEAVPDPHRLTGPPCPSPGGGIRWVQRGGEELMKTRCWRPLE